MKTKIILDFYTTEDSLDSVFNKQHLKCIKWYKKVFNEAHINVIVDDINNQTLILETQKKLFNAFVHDDIKISFDVFQDNTNFRQRYYLLSDVIKNQGNLIFFMNNFMNFDSVYLDYPNGLIKYITYLYTWICFNGNEFITVTNKPLFASVPFIEGDFDIDDQWNGDSRSFSIVDNVFVINTQRYLNFLQQIASKHCRYDVLLNNLLFYCYRYRFCSGYMTLSFNIDIVEYNIEILKKQEELYKEIIELIEE